MRKRKWFYYAITICFVVLFIGGIWESICLYQKYPNPEIQTYELGESAQIGSYAVSVGDWHWDDGSSIMERFPEYDFYLTMEDGRKADLRVGLVTILLKKNMEGDDVFSFPMVAFSSGAWGNQYDMELFFLLNPHLKTMTFDLPVGEMENIILPIVMMDPQYTKKQWKEIDSREFYIGLQFYPVHIRFACGGA